MTMATEHGVELLVVRVELLNDSGERRECTAAGLTVDQAVWEASAAAHLDTGDDTWAMNDWRPA